MAEVRSFPRRSVPVRHAGYVCPGCGSWRVVPVIAGHERRRFCAACEACWEVHADIAVRVDPLQCEGCGREGECFARLQHDIPTFTWNAAAEF